MPPEIRNAIRCFVATPFGTDPSPKPTRYLPDNEPQFWFDCLTSGQSLPWLWDLDRDMCERMYHSSPPNGAAGWDWERLIRTLAQQDFFEQGGIIEYDVPLGLRNRRRIWKFTSEMRVPHNVEDDGQQDKAVLDELALTYSAHDHLHSHVRLRILAFEISGPTT